MFRSGFFRQTAFLISCFVAGQSCTGAMNVEPARVHEIALMLPAHATGLGVPAIDRDAWNVLAKKPAFERWLKTAHQLRAEPFPKMADDLYLDFSRTGNRTHWQDVEFERRKRISIFALAECLEYKGQFIRPLESAINEICAEPTWVYPAHDRSLGNFKGTVTDIDLGSSRLAWELATIDYLLADKLSPATRTLIRDNLRRRIFKPFRDMVEGRVAENFWMRMTHNWNAVCLSGVAGAALSTLDSPEERAWFVASAEIYIRFFLKGFGSDGYCSEGLGYWNYGFGRFVLLGETVRQATGGRIDLLADPAARLPALFGRRVEILNDIYPSIADCHPATKPDPQISAYICRRFNLSPCSNDPEMFVRPDDSIFNAALFIFLPEQLPTIRGELPSESPFRTWFHEGGVLICRPAAQTKVPFAVSLKGGNNAEHHNHNDLGSFIVVAGKSMVLADPGAEVYTARTFSGRRYESDVLNSFGHDVPVVAGKLQRAGADARAEVLRAAFKKSEDVLALDLRSAYAVPTLNRLERTFLYRREGMPSLTVRDDVEFKAPESFETALVTWGKWKQLSASELLVTEQGGAVRVRVDTGGVPFEFKTKQLEADVLTSTKATRIGLLLKQPVTKASVVMTVTPELPAISRERSKANSQ